jgi:hypothetical protein
MAKVLFTAVVADMRNKLNGSVFSKNRYGGYVRTKVTPVNPQTTAQANVRNRLATNSQAWRGLTEAERQSWIDAAPSFPMIDIFGNSKILSGSALYVKLNNNLVNISVTPIATAPAPTAIPSFILGTLTSAEGVPALSVTWTAPDLTATQKVVFQATPNVGAGISFVKNKFRQIAVVAGSSSSPTDLLTAYQAVFGDPIATQKIFVRAFVIDTVTGQAGIPSQAVAIVSA